MKKPESDLLEDIKLIRDAILSLRTQYEIPIGYHKHLDEARECLRLAGQGIIQNEEAK